MAMDGLRGYLLLASGLADMSRAKATEAASALLSLSSGLTGGRSSSTVQLQVQDLAEELLAAAAANRRSLIALVRNEVERAVARSPIPPDELNRARAAVAKLSADVEALQAQILTNPAVGEVAGKLGLAGHTVSRPADEGVVVDAAFTSPVFTSPVDEPVPAAPRRRPPRKQIADRASTRPVATDAGDGGAERPTKSFAAPTEPAVTTTTTAPAKTAATTGGHRRRRRRPTRRRPNKAATNKAATGNKAATKKAATKRAAPAKRAATTTVAPTTTAPAKKAATKKAANKKAAPAKNAATTTTARPAKKAAKRTTSSAAARRVRRRGDHEESGEEDDLIGGRSGASVRRGDHEESGEEDDLIGGRSGASVPCGDHEEGAHGDVRRHEVSSEEVRRQEVRRQEVAARPATTPATGSGA